MSDEGKKMARETAKRGLQIEEVLKEKNVPLDEVTALAMFSVSVMNLARHYGPSRLASTVALLINIWRKTEVQVALNMVESLADILSGDDEEEQVH